MAIVRHRKSEIPGKIPSYSGMTFGEIFVNYASGTGKSFLATLKNDNKSVAQFMEKSYNDSVYANKQSFENLESNAVTGIVLSDKVTEIGKHNGVVTIPIPQGAQGLAGPQGYQGAQGAIGTPGARGTQGGNGEGGYQGTQGQRGATGSRGTQGGNGEVGYQGTQGSAGATGSRGTQGGTGVGGHQGTQGPGGADGSRGTQGGNGEGGYQGTQGKSGATGSRGTQGGNGEVGYQGTQGPGGVGGSRGTQGSAGLQGYQGTQGVVGATGQMANLTTGTTTAYLIGKSGTTSSGWTGTFLMNKSVYMQSGLLYASSDETLKDFHGDIDLDFEKLKLIRKQYFTWKEGDVTDMQIGTSAQDLQKVYPEIVSVGDDGKLAVSYERLSIIALAAIDKLHDRIKILEEKLRDKE